MTKKEESNCVNRFELLNEKKELSFNDVPLALLFLIQKLENLEALLHQQQAPQSAVSDRITDLKEVENLTGYGKSKIYKLTSTGKIPHKLMGNRLVFSRSELLQWLDSSAVTRKPKSNQVLTAIAHSAANKDR